MRNLFICIALLFTATFAVAQRAKISYEQYISRYQDYAIDNMKTYRIPASVTMAQALLESGAGNSSLALEANNHFGIKCKSGWNGDYVLHDDDAAGECFRKYKSVEDSYIDHSEFLKGSARYSGLFKLNPHDYEAWAQGLQTAGYATNPQYAVRLIKLIDDYELHKLDEKVKLYQEQESVLIPEVILPKEQPTAPPVSNSGLGLAPYQSPKVNASNYMVTANRGARNRMVYKNNGASFIVTEQGDSFESLAKELKIGKKTLWAFNDIRADQELSRNQMVYITKKKKKTGNGFNFYTVEKGDNLYLISQRFGVMLPELLKRNYMTPDYEVKLGQRIRLR